MKKKQLILGTAIITTAVLVAGGALYFARKGPVTPGRGAEAAAVWHKSEEDALAEARDRRAPILVDFYADWCDPCIQMEQQVFSTDDFKKKAKDFVLYRVDATNESNEIARLLQKYEVAGLPSLRFRKPDGAALPQFDVDGGLELPQLAALMDEARDAATR